MIVKINGILIEQIESKLNVPSFSFLEKIAKDNKEVIARSGVGVSFLTASSFVVGQIGLYESIYPVIQIVQELGRPLGIIMALFGLYYVMIGEKDKGFQMIKLSLVGYAGTYIIPYVFDVISTVGKGFSGGM